MKYATGKYQTAKYGVHVPLKLDEVTEQAPWERPFGEGPTIRVKGLDSSGGPTTTLIEIAKDRVQPYWIEVHEAGGDLVAPIMRWWGGALKETANEPSVLSFTVEYDNPNRAAISADVDRVIWLRDGYRMVIGKFQVSNLITGHSLDTRTQTIVCQDSLAQLQGEGVNGYTTVTGASSHTKSIGTIVRELLGLQQRTDTVGFGGIFNGISRISRELIVSKGTILGALQRLQRMLPLARQGHMWIDADGKFQWTSVRGYAAGQTISVGGNMRGVMKDEDRTGLITRVTFLGGGEDEDTQMSVTVTASTSGTWGIRTGPPIEDRRVTHLSTLTAMANRFLDEHKNPRYVYTVDVVNLANADGTRFDNWEELYIGTKVRVLSEDAGIDEQVFIKSITRDLDNPLRMEVEIDNRAETMGRILASIFDRLEERVVINDDGTQNPNMARIYEEEDLVDLPDMHDFKNGDLKWDAGELAYRDGAAWETIPKLGTNIQSVGAANSPGASTTESSPVDHVHEGGETEHTHTPSFEVPIKVQGTIFEEGTADTFVRSDHQHGVLHAVPVRIAGTTPTSGPSGNEAIAKAKHQHGLEDNLTDKDDGTIAYIGTEFFGKIDGADVSLTRIE